MGRKWFTFVFSWVRSGHKPGFRSSTLVIFSKYETQLHIISLSYLTYHSFDGPVQFLPLKCLLVHVVRKCPVPFSHPVLGTSRRVSSSASSSSHFLLNHPILKKKTDINESPPRSNMPLPGKKAFFFVSAKRNIQWFKDSRNNYCHERPNIYQDTTTPLCDGKVTLPRRVLKKCGFTFLSSKFRRCN
jgi:hypothetical protein